MKEYQKTKIWATEIACLSELIDEQIDYKKSRIQTMESEDRCEDSWYQQQIDELKEQIETLIWALNQINAPFKIKR